MGGAALDIGNRTVGCGMLCWFGAEDLKETKAHAPPPRHIFPDNAARSEAGRPTGVSLSLIHHYSGQGPFVKGGNETSGEQTNPSRHCHGMYKIGNSLLSST
mmetsp:Transcript_9603/g.20792  ORF Transcript_9603/g.20792 Transcript_9603/m.20792 type:complete len:102 (-) Transcript_9603:2088-2393(-)